MLIQYPKFIMDHDQGLVHRLQAVILWFMNYDYCFMKWVLGVLIFVMLLTTACSSVQKSSSRPAIDTASTPVESFASDVAESELPSTDPDVMYHVFSAEVLGAEGDFSAAAAEYLKAALISKDPEIAERATQVAVSAGQWQMVALASDRWATLEPESLDARELAAGSRLREGDYVGAEFQLARILELTKFDQAHGWRMVAALLAPANDQIRAKKVLDKLLDDFDARSNVEALFARSQLAARIGNLDTATELVDQAIILQPKRADLLAWSGRLAVNLGDDALALKRYRRAWEASSKNRHIAMAYAELLKQNEDPISALAVLAQLPDTPDMRFTRIVFALDAGDRDSAETLYLGFSEAQYAEASDTAFQAAQSAELLGYQREAIDWYKQVTGEQSLRATLRQAFMLDDLGDFEEARKLLAQLRIQADDGVRSQSYQVEAQILQGADRADEAIQLLNDALTELPDDNPLRYARALLAVGLNQLELAESDLRQVILVQPGNAAAINALGYTLADLTERYDEALVLILQAYELEPGDASIIDSMGWVSYRLGRLREAEGYLREAWKRMRNAEIAAHLGEVLWVSGKKDEARALWALGIQLESDNKVLIKTLQQFGELP